MMGYEFEALVEATSGAVGGLLSTAILYPLDTCKTKFQAEVDARDSPRYRSLFDVLKDAISSSQVLALYQGLGTKSFQSVVSQFIYFYSYSYLKSLYMRKSKKTTVGAGPNLIMAAAASACTTLLTQPLDTASTRMQTSTFGKSRGLWSILTEGNWKQAYDGIGASLLLTSNPAIQYTVFEQLKGQLIRKQKREVFDLAMAGNANDKSVEASPVVLSAFSAFLLGAFSKTVSTILTYPAIRCKAIIQSTASDNEKDSIRNEKIIKSHQDKPPKSMLDAIHLVWSKEGFLGFYKALQAQILKTVLSAALMLMIKEKISKGTWLILFAFRRWMIITRTRLNKI